MTYIIGIGFLRNTEEGADLNGKRILALLLTAALLLVGGAAAAAGATSGDPLVSLSYLRQVFVTPMDQRISAGAERLLTSSLSRLDGGTWSAALTARLDEALSAALTERVSARVAQRLAAAGTSAVTANFTEIALVKGDKLVGPPGAGVILKSGAGQICGAAGATVLNVTAGGLRTPGSAIRTGIYYMTLADDGSGVEITSDAAVALVRDGAHKLTVTPPYAARNTAYADALRGLSLFFGTNKGYELERAPTRQEALIMLIRLLGEEQQALAYTGVSTFGDVTGWADGQKYIAYGEHRGYTNGNGLMPDGRVKFSQGAAASLDMYLTFVLRALGYDDRAGDFVWNTTSRTLAVEKGLLTAQDVQTIQSTGLLRDHVVYISYHALWATMKDSTATLGDKLVASGAVSRAALDSAAGLK